MSYKCSYWNIADRANGSMNGCYQKTNSPTERKKIVIWHFFVVMNADDEADSPGKGQAWQADSVILGRQDTDRWWLRCRRFNQSINQSIRFICIVPIRKSHLMILSKLSSHSSNNSLKTVQWSSWSHPVQAQTRPIPGHRGDTPWVLHSCCVQLHVAKLRYMKPKSLQKS